MFFQGATRAGGAKMMKAAAFHAINEMTLLDAPEPRPGADEVILKVHNCGICGSDLHLVQHGLARQGTIMGHEFSGEIAELGAGVRDFRIGERVTALPYISCGACDHCLTGDAMHCPGMRGLGLGHLPGAYAEYVMCGVRSLLRLPDHVSSREGALVEPLAVGLHGVNRAVITPGIGCVVMGAGPIGLATLLWCRARGAGAVVVSEIAPGRAELAMKLGATAVVNPHDESPSDKVRELTGDEPALVFECIGVKSTLMEAVKHVGRHGQVVVIGVCLETDTIMPLSCISKEVRMDFAMAYTRAEFQVTVDALSSGLIDPKPMITDVIALDQIPSMFEALRKPGSQAKVMVEFPH
jgi:(R,R)-butanediol dehydrogenase / meso-butanediol dehydrogenase / diacetyl reductase